MQKKKNQKNNQPLCLFFESDYLLSQTDVSNMVFNNLSNLNSCIIK